MAKYINTAMAIEALQKGLDIWWFVEEDEYGHHWTLTNIAMLAAEGNKDEHFALGEKPTSPPRKMIEIDGVRMPAPIMREEELPETVGILFSDGCTCTLKRDTFSARCRAAENGNVFATEADAIAARDARKLILERAMERAK